jgi:pimeloyl-ACP methyl ester carboxylesterase
MVRDLDSVVARVGRSVVLAGNSMGAATAAAYALQHPERVSALVQITPGFAGAGRADDEMGDWDALADGLERGGVDGFMEAYVPPAEPRFRDESDPGHPLALAQAYADHLPNSTFLVEAEGHSPIAWQGAQLSRAIEAFLRESGLL